MDPRQLGAWKCCAVARASQMRGEHVDLPLEEQPCARAGDARGGDGGDGIGEQVQTGVRAVGGGLAGARGGAGRQGGGMSYGGGAMGGNGGGQDRLRIHAFRCSGAKVGRNGRIHAIRNVCYLCS